MDDKTFHTLARAIAKALGGAITRRNEAGNPPFADFMTREGLPLDVSTTWNKPGMLNVRLVMPVVGESACRYIVRDLYSADERKAGTPITEIGVSAAKGAERIAADITRRLVPGASDAYKRALAQKERSDAFRKGKADTVARLCKALTCESRNDTVYADGCHMQVSGPQSIQIERMYVTPETALKIHALLLADKGRGDE